MNIKDLVISFLIALTGTILIQYFFLGRNEAVDSTAIQSGMTFAAPQLSQVRPINVDVDFVDTKRTHKQIVSEIETDHGIYFFSSDGALLERLIFKQNLNGAKKFISTVHPSSNIQEEQRTFLLAFAEKTPYYYELLGKDENENTIELKYRAYVDSIEVIKTFVVYKSIHRIDLIISINAGDKLVQPRIFYQAPEMPEIASQDIISGVVNTQKGTIKTIPRAKLDINAGWFLPSLFGADNKYFIHAMVKDEDLFAQRGYYQLYGHHGINTILEGPEITESKTWNISFYFGPKKEEAIAAVDPRLEQTLDYSGILAPFARFFLAVLKFIHSYIPNYGWAIIILTLLIKFILLPFSLNGEEASKKRSEIEKKLSYLKQRYKNEPALLAQERAALIRQQGMPGMASCLPLLLQIPIFFALSRILSSSIELYQAPFGGWIHDLSARDPYYILPLIIVFAMFFAALQAEPNQRMTMMMAALFFGAFSANFAAGLALYLAVNALFGLAQSFLQKKMKSA